MLKTISVLLSLSIALFCLAGCASKKDLDRDDDIKASLTATTTTVVTTEKHNYIKTEVIEEPSCYKEGRAKYVCSDCGAEKEDSLPAEGHEWDAVGGVRSSKTCRKCQSFKLGYSDIKPDDWMIGRDNSFVQFKNAMVNFEGFTGSQAVSVSCTPVCRSCRVAHIDDREYCYVTENAPVSFTYHCVECGASTDVGIVLRY
ncbi:MAG: hypothetical protein K6C14_06275, partial [Eubacterium sp.]|nr:hypothetical protein [Eubacterium sp.]